MIHVCSLQAMPSEAARLGPTHLISILDPEDYAETPGGVDPARHWRFGFNDISEPEPDQLMPEQADIERLLKFGDGWDGVAVTLIHCQAGISRSTAAALILICQRNAGRELEAAERLRSAGQHAWPNRRMIEFADGLLGCDGRMVDALRVLPMPPSFDVDETISLAAAL